ncbi:Nucleic acid-binding, OB-fold, partial [Sesbania bispinosa]
MWRTTVVAAWIEMAQHFIRKFSSSVVEGDVYKLTDFGIVRNLGKFRATTHEFKLTFNANTKLIPTPCGSIPCHGLSFLKTSDIMKTNGHSDYLLDFMGILTAVSDEMTMTSRDGRQTRLIQLHLVDEMGEIRCAIFGDFIDVVRGLLALPRAGLPVVILQLVKVNNYKGEVGIQNVMNASKILWELDMPEALQFKQELAIHEVESDLKIGVLVPKSETIVPLRDDFLKLHPRMTLCQLVATEE